jgi:hypothetical protein
MDFHITKYLGKKVIPYIIAGGIFAIRKNKYLELKGYDEDCYGYAHEDDIMDVKINKMELLTKRLDNHQAIHMYHNVEENIYYTRISENRKLWQRYVDMNKEELTELLCTQKI